MSAIQFRQETPGERYLRIMLEIFGDHKLSDEALARVEELVVNSLDRIKAEDEEESRTLEIEENFALLATHIVNSDRLDESAIRLEDIERALGALCPLYPIC